MLLLFIYFAISIGFSFLCSILEAVLLSITPSYVTQQVQSNTSTGILLSRYKDDLDKPLSAILTLNTIAHTIGAIMVGVQASNLFGETEIPLPGGFHLSYEALIAGLMTFFILVLSEIIPKTIGANNWRSLAPFTAKTLRVIIWILYPFVWLSKLITGMLKSDKSASVLSRADFAAIASVGKESGALAAEESEIIKNLLNFERKMVRDIMTPRTVVYMVQKDTTIKSFIENPKSSTFSRIPIFGNDKDDITGIALRDDILLSYLKERRENDTIENVARAAKFVSPQMKLHDLFNQLTAEKQHMFIVRDEFGNVVGVVTMEDVFETLLGKEIVDESDKVVDLQALAKDRLKKEEAAQQKSNDQ
ncbi:hemolysin family protein [Portibacter marinus]|uniref:hemolysin family protein n=1 Tax=Portibacter marinus TaxID=2898660 RepID=UPI001F358A82|nr:hemolysin family protein [Portibacter marinus]